MPELDLRNLGPDDLPPLTPEETAAWLAHQDQQAAEEEPDPNICENCGEDIREHFSTPDGNHLDEEAYKQHISNHGRLCPECATYVNV